MGGVGAPPRGYPDVENEGAPTNKNLRILRKTRKDTPLPVEGGAREGPGAAFRAEAAVVVGPRWRAKNVEKRERSAWRRSYRENQRSPSSSREVPAPERGLGLGARRGGVRPRQGPGGAGPGAQGPDVCEVCEVSEVSEGPEVAPGREEEELAGRPRRRPCRALPRVVPARGSYLLSGWQGRKL